jgi:hypothetical protein
VTGADGKKIIAPDPDEPPIVTKLFAWYATGKHSLKEAAWMAREAGLRLSQDRLEGAGEYGPHDPEQSPLHGLV